MSKIKLIFILLNINNNNENITLNNLVNKNIYFIKKF